MKKRVLLSVFFLVFMFFLMPLLVFATSVQNELKNSHKNVYADYDGNDFSGINTFTLNNLENIQNIDPNDPSSDFSFWHFIDTSGNSSYAILTFQENGINVDKTVYPSGGGQHYAVITPSNWKLMNGVSYSTSRGQFNLSHSGRKEAQAAKLNVSALVNPFRYRITPHEYYSRSVDKYYNRTVDKYYERTVDAYYERTVDKYYHRTVDKYFERPVFEYYGRFAQRFFIPVFDRNSYSINDTLVTRLDYSKNTIKAEPLNGGAFVNGHTYVKVNVAEAQNENGIWYTIADSSKNNGRKTPDQYNRPIDYKYNVKIQDGKLTVSFNENLINASVGAYVVSNPNDFRRNAPKHYKNSVTVDLPNNHDGYVYLYTHIESLQWHGDYYFVEWRYDESKDYFGDYKLLNTKYGKYSLVDTVYGDYKYRNTVYGDYELIDTVYGNYELVNTVYGNYGLFRTKYGEYQLIKTTEHKEKEYVPYTGTLKLKVNNLVKNLNEDLILAPGVYTLTLTSSDNVFEPISKTITIASGEEKNVIFDTFNYLLDDEILETVVHRYDRKATIHKFDKRPTIHESDKPIVVHESNKEIQRHYLDRMARIHRSNKEPIKYYNEEYFYRPDKKLGDDNDPYGIYAIRLS